MFAQTYTLLPEDAIKLRMDNVSANINRALREEIFKELEKLMRNNPFGETFMTAGEKIKEVEANRGEIPHFQVLFL